MGFYNAKNCVITPVEISWTCYIKPKDR